MKLLLTTLLAILVQTALFAQNEIGIHQQELEKYKELGYDAAYYESQPTEIVGFEKTGCNLDKVVYGWHPYWVGSAYQNYQWDLLSHFSFFSYEVNAADGQPNSTNGWSTSAAVTAALASGNTKVTLCVTLFSGHSTFFGSSTAQQTLITNLINLVQSRGAHGVNIDFEGLPSSQTTNFANFMVNLSNQMHTAIPGSEVSTVLYAVDWNNVFDFNIMEPEVDHYIIMGYGYYYGGSSTAGPTDPLYHFGSTYNYTLSRSITYYLYKGCPANKLVLGLPEYGYEWSTSALTIPSSTTSSGTARTYAYVKNNTSGNYSAGNHIWEQDSYTDVYAFNSGGNKQCMISQDSAWRKRLEHVRRTGIAGIGIWALGYDNGYTELWDGIDQYLTDCYADPCSGTIHDFGGLYKNYYDRENYTWTVAPPGAYTLDVQFSMFDVELNWDYLYVYDGPDDTYPQLSGSPFTGTNSPGSFTTSTGAVTFKFTSDGATTAPGFLATYNCNTLPPPTAGFSTSIDHICAGDSILLQNSSIGGDTYLWTTSLGSLSNDTTNSPYLYPTVSGSYDVSLTATNATGTDQYMQSINIVVDAPPMAQASVNSSTLLLPNAVAYFTNSSQNASYYFWDFGDGSTSSDASPWHEYTAPGTYQAWLVAYNGVCPSDTITFEITVEVLGLNEATANAISIYPNPTRDYLTVTLLSLEDQVILYNALGQEIPVPMEVTGTNVKLDLRELASGWYEIYVKSVETTEKLPFIRQ